MYFQAVQAREASWLEPYPNQLASTVVGRARAANNGIKNLKWTLSMARTNDPHSASSQFFINLVNNVSLDHTEETIQGWGYAVFGEVVDGFETVEAIAATATGSSGFHQDVPIEEISITDTKVTTE